MLCSSIWGIVHVRIMLVCDLPNPACPPRREASSLHPERVRTRARDG